MIQFKSGVIYRQKIKAKLVSGTTYIRTFTFLFTNESLHLKIIERPTSDKREL